MILYWYKHGEELTGKRSVDPRTGVVGSWRLVQGAEDELHSWNPI
jgi:hypothetical protein